MNCARWVLVFWLVLTGVTLATEDNCPVCGERFGKNIYRMSRTGYKDKVLICDRCVKLETVCYICDMPVARRFTTCKDGRLICEEDAARAVMDQDTAEKLFLKAKDWCQSLLSRYGTLPHRNVSIRLEAKAQLDRTGNLIDDHPDALLMGLTQTTKGSDGKYEHAVSLLHGLIQERFLCVSIHEYAHAWLYENAPAGRKVHAATLEGFCEWLAYKFATESQFEHEVQMLTKNVYSRGQMHAFVAAENEHGMYRVIQWMKYGVDIKLDSDALGRVLELTKPAEPEPAASMPTVAMVARPSAAPHKLLLKGISGTKARRFALINDQTFVAGEQNKVRLGTSNVVVRCVEIRDKSVVVQLPGTGEREVLELGAD